MLCRMVLLRLMIILFLLSEYAALTFDYTGAVQEFAVDPGSVLSVTVCGAQGGTGLHTLQEDGIKGSCVVSNIVVPDGISNLYIYVGGHPNKGDYQDANGGWNGGGNGECCYTPYSVTFYGGGGGGRSDIRTSTDVNDALIVAGGGGGSGAGCYRSCGAMGNQET